MKYFERVRIPNRAKVWALFADLSSIPSSVEVNTWEIIRAASNGSVDLDEDFNLRNYCNAINHNNRLELNKHWKQNIPLLPNWEDGDDTVQGSCYGVTEGQLDIDYHGYITHTPSFELEMSLDEIRGVWNDNPHLGINLEECLENALLGFKSASRVLKDFVNEYPDYYNVVCSYLKERENVL